MKNNTIQNYSCLKIQLRKIINAVVGQMVNFFIACGKWLDDHLKYEEHVNSWLEQKMAAAQASE